MATIFITVFLAELGDNTQLATLLFASDKAHNPYLLVLIAASRALIAATSIAVLADSFAEKYLAVVPLKLIVGMGFVAIGLWTIVEHFRG